MAASSIVPTRSRRDVRAVAARAAARRAPRGHGLAPVVPLPVRTSAVAPPPAPVAVPGVERPALRVVAGGASRGAMRRALARVLIAAGVTVLLLGVLAGPVRSLLDGGAVPVAAGHVVLQPGETLWDVAVRSAPAGVDPRQQLETLRELNGFGAAALDAWTVVLVPAP